MNWERETFNIHAMTIISPDILTLAANDFDKWEKFKNREKEEIYEIQTVNEETYRWGDGTLFGFMISDF